MRSRDAVALAAPTRFANWVYPSRFNLVKQWGQGGGWRHRSWGPYTRCLWVYRQPSLVSTRNISDPSRPRSGHEPAASRAARQSRRTGDELENGHDTEYSLVLARHEPLSSTPGLLPLSVPVPTSHGHPCRKLAPDTPVPVSNKPLLVTRQTFHIPEATVAWTGWSYNHSATSAAKRGHHITRCIPCCRTRCGSRFPVRHRCGEITGVRRVVTSIM